MRNFSIRILMAFIFVFGVGMAALRNANAWCAGAMLLVALAAIGAAVLGVIIMRGRERYWWLGFGLFCGEYLILTFAPGLGTEVMPRLPTTLLLNYVHSEFAASHSYAPLPEILWWQHGRALKQVDRLKAENREPGDPELDSAVRMLANLEEQLRDAADRRDFTRVGHSLFAFLFGLIGGMIGVWFHSRRRRGQTAAA